MEENKKDSEKLVGAVADWVETYRNLMGVRIVEHTSHGSISKCFWSANHAGYRLYSPFPGIGRRLVDR